VTTAIVIASIVSLAGVLTWIGLLIWAARDDGRIQRQHEREARRRS
jgi:hypothetical protein